MINNIFFTFRCVNKKNGILLTIIHCFSISSYYLFNAQQLGEPLLSNDINLFDRIGICFNLLFAFLVFLFFIHQTIDTNIKASLKIKNINQEIFNQFEIINQQNEEKTILLKEIHHRVKNNLQIIISLLRLQSYQIEDSESLQSFNEAINRIMAISSIHEKIYQNDSFANIKIEEYFNDLIREIISNSTIHSKIETTLTFEVESIKLNPIVPLALIINELISNSIKHYDEKNQKINIELKFKKVGDKNLQITYSDNGVWKESTKKNTLGIELITALTKQINGNLILTKNPSTKYVFDFENII
jgi:two-component sensor histidine kinase